jgi:hypothetical protein
MLPAVIVDKVSELEGLFQMDVLGRSAVLIAARTAIAAVRRLVSALVGARASSIRLIVSTETAGTLASIRHECGPLIRSAIILLGPIRT